MSGGLKVQRANRPRIVQLEREIKAGELTWRAPLVAGDRMNPGMVGQGVLDNVCLAGRRVWDYAILAPK